MLKDDTSKVALITGGAKRIGAHISQALHAAGWRTVIHFNTSAIEAHQLCGQLNAQRPQSAYSIHADLANEASYTKLIDMAINNCGRLDALINNASVFSPSAIGSVTQAHWQQIFSVNVQAPFFLAQHAAPYLKEYQGSIINITDTHADNRPIKDYAIYSMSKAALLMQTAALARELAPLIRVNAVAPGVSMWNKSTINSIQEEIIERTPLKRSAYALEIAKAVLFLANEATYTTGSTIYVDGGRCVYN